ncbi:HEAT repeat domain-containing protein [Haloterrigena alkaliphila]|uniref:HEAT repeat domain-containing protein n=1 Tax=Haloterrigena alkaliphila TaxID=2816475 RepID=A0A8A2VEE2_9EURY|nr:HEAT repeat domain-containing protein [Haloterrigena alkaliphila]QSW98774.1 HEAT repeat domain-containing protein [Haloterrigena alkaliphila]
MNREGGDAVGQQRPDAAFDLPSVLARLDTREPAEQRAAVAAIHDALTDRPEACLPAVPKLRDLLAQPEIDFRERVGYCLAELATVSPSDVAPSTDGIVSVIVDDPAAPATDELLRCLETIAAERPSAVADHVGAIATVLDSRPSHDRRGVRVLRDIATDRPEAIEPAASVLVAALESDDPAIRADACTALGHARLEAAADRLEGLAHRDPEPTVRERADWALGRLQ